MILDFGRFHPVPPIMRKTTRGWFFYLLRSISLFDDYINRFTVAPFLGSTKSADCAKTEWLEKTKRALVKNKE